MENRRVLLAVLLSMVVIIGWQLLFPPPEPPLGRGAGQEEGETEARQGTETGRGQRSGEEPAGGASPMGPMGEGEREGSGLDAEVSPSDALVRAEREERISLETASFRAELSNRGAQLVSLRLAEYSNPDGEAVELVRHRREALYPFGLVDARGEALAVGDALFAIEEGRTEEGDPSVLFTYSGPEGRVVKRFTALSSGLLDVSIEARGVGSWGVVLGPGLRNPTKRDEERRFKYRGAVYLSGDDVETIAPEKVAQERVIPGADLRWIGLEDTYFLSALVPRTGVERAVLRPFVVEPAQEGAPAHEPVPAVGLTEELEDGRRELQVAVMPVGDRLDATAYLGAKDLEGLGTLRWRLEETVRLGMFGFFSKGLLTGLKWIHENVVGNYGWAIVLMTVLIKLVLLPLTHKSYVSMQKMQEVAPRIKSIRNKYKPKLRDKKGRPDVEQQRKMNEEIQALYKSEGVNPAGGCLPILLQFPVLIAFYRLLSNAVELRDAPWIFWIEDLSLHDPIYVLPVVMGAIQFVQQRMAPSAADPMQRRMMMAMPVVFTFLFLGFPSGLVLYWLTNTVLTVIQQGAYQSWKARKEAG